MNSTHVSFEKLMNGLTLSIRMSGIVTFVLWVIMMLVSIFEFSFELNLIIKSLSGMFYFGAIVAFITLIIGLIIGFPTTYLLVKLSFQNSVLSGFIGMLASITLACFYLPSWQFITMFAIYGALCGWSFMKGYERGVS